MPRPQPNVLLVVLDCLRLDRFRRSMPLARKATRGWFKLDNHWSVAHCSDPNISALLTGFGPWQTGVTTQMGTGHVDALPTLFWRWKRDVGGTVWAVQPVRVPAFYRQHVDLVAWHRGTDSSDPELRAVRAFVKEAAPGKPWLGFIRSMTCHYPYLELPSPPRGAGGAADQYEQAVAHEDRFIANLVQFLQRDYPNTITVVCSDHGELLGEHGEWDHLYTLYSILTRAPMAVYVPGLKPKKTTRPTQHVDLLPTLCDLLGLERQGEGASWMEWMTGKTAHPSPADRTMMLQGTGAGPATAEGEDPGTHQIDPGVNRVLWRHRGVVRGPWKLTQDWHAEGTLTTRVTRAADYREKDAVGPDGRHTKLMADLPPFPEYHEWERVKVYGREHDGLILERLKALGYA